MTISKRAVLCAALLLCGSLGSAMPDEAAERQLIVAAINGNIDGVRVALKNGASINVRDSRGRTGSSSRGAGSWQGQWLREVGQRRLLKRSAAARLAAHTRQS